MPSTVPSYVNDRSITAAGRRVGLLIPTTAAIICVVLQYYFTNFFDAINITNLVLTLGGLVILTLADVFNKYPSRSWRYIHWTLVHVFYLVRHWLFTAFAKPLHVICGNAGNARLRLTWPTRLGGQHLW